MKMLRWSLGCVSLVAITLFSGCGSKDNGPTGSQQNQAGDTVWVDSISAVAASQAIIDITIRNSTAIASVEVPLRLAGADFAIDSGSYVGGSFAGAYLKTVIIDSTQKTVYFIAGHSSGTTTAAGTSRLATLYVTLGAGAADQVVTVDSAFVPISGNVYHVVAYATPDMAQILPVFQAGKIVVAP